MKPFQVILIGVLSWSGCASVHLPPEAATVSLMPVSSSSVEIHRPRFRIKDGGLMLEAYVMRQWKAVTTADTHVDIVFMDAAGKTVAVETTNFHPRSLPQSGVRGKPHAYLLIPIKVPADTRAIEVRAHDGAHSP